jgi:acetate kinase
VVNAGSGSLKLEVVTATGSLRDSENIDGDPRGAPAWQALDTMVSKAANLVAVGHRVVHGGQHYTAPALVDDRLVEDLRALVSLAPLHLPPAIDVIGRCRERLPDLPHVACFDTAFHSAMPEAARTYAIPRRWREEYGVRRYGFHGISYAGATRRAAELLGREVSDLRLVLAHLGGGASVCAVSGGRSVWTSMGFTPLEGLPMVRRSGSVDPGMLLWLQTEHGLTAGELSQALQRESGLTGLTDGRTGDTRDLVRFAASGDEQAQLALEVYCLRVRQEVAAAAACLPRLDALVFTGEIGTDQPEIREAVTAGLPVLGLRPGLDSGHDEDQVLAAGPPAVVLVKTREELEIARQIRTFIGES